MKHQRVTLKTLRASAQPRPLVTADVDKLAASIKEIGLIQPITVRAVTVINGIAEEGFQIVAGHHRVAACRALGWDEIDAIVIVAAEHLQAELIEIDENLCRSELTASQRSGFTKRRKEIWEALHPVEKAAAKLEVGEVCPPQEFSHGGARPQEKGFAASTAAITGEAKRTINQHIARAEAIGDDLPRVQGTSLDKGVELDALAKLPEPERKGLIDRAVAGEVVTARAPAPPKPAPRPVHPAAVFLSVMGEALEQVKALLGCDTTAQLATKLAEGAHNASAQHLHDLDLLLTEFMELGAVATKDEVPQ